MKFPKELKYSKSHEWLRFSSDKSAEIGLSDYAQQELGQIVFVNLPEVGDSLSLGEVFADVESVKAVSDVFSPVSATVVEINEEVLDSPESLNNDPYGTWLTRVENISDTAELLDAAAYEAFCAKEKGAH